MKEIKLSFPYPSTSRHNLSQDVGTSLSMGLVTPVRVVEVLGGDSHRISTSYSLISNPLIKPLLQGVRMRYCRFWVPRRIYHIDQRANNSNYDLMDSPVRHGQMRPIYYPVIKGSDGNPVQYSNFEQSSLFDYLGLSNIENHLHADVGVDGLPVNGLRISDQDFLNFNVEPYIGYVDICRNYFADSATGTIAWSWLDEGYQSCRTAISSLDNLDAYIDNIQNSRGLVRPYDINRTYTSSLPVFTPFFLSDGTEAVTPRVLGLGDITTFPVAFSRSRFGLCVPMNRPDRLSRLFNTKPLTSQNATISSGEITIANLSFLEKVQRYLTRRFFGGSRFTDIMYSVLGQKVPHVDSPVLLDVFDAEIGSELVASTNSTETQNPGVLGGYFASADVLSTGRRGSRKRYRFNEPGYIIDLCYIMPRLFRTSFYSDFYPLPSGITASSDKPMLQGNFIPDFNGIGWQQPAFVSKYRYVRFTTDEQGNVSISSIPQVPGFCCEPSWQQFRTLPDVCSGAFNNTNAPFGSFVASGNPQIGLARLGNSFTINSPLYVFTDRMKPFAGTFGTTQGSGNLSTGRLAQCLYTDFNSLNGIFGLDMVYTDNIFVVFRYAHQAKRQVTKRFTLTFN